MPERIPVFVYARDPVSEAGAVAQLRARPDVRVVDELELDGAQVAVVVAEGFDADTGRSMRAIQRNGCPRIVVVVTRLDDTGLAAAVEAGARSILRRQECTTERLVTAVRAAAAGQADLAPDLVGRLLDQVMGQQDRALPQGAQLAGLNEREVVVLRLLADGLDTTDIASTMAYSERTVKGIIHEVTSRLQLRNRSHAVAYAMRQGLI